MPSTRIIEFFIEKNAPTEDLIAVDLICHGVPSPAVWEEYYTELKGNKNKERCAINFRSKSMGWKNFSLKIERFNTNKNTEVLYESNKESDAYIKGFLDNLFLRPSCYECRFKSVIHSSDLTLGDFWHYENEKFNLIDDDTGISLVVAQSKRGYDFLNELNGVSIQEVPCSVISYANKNMLRSPYWNRKRENFFNGYNEYKKNYCGEQAMISYLKNVSMKDSPRTIAKRFLKKIIRR